MSKITPVYGQERVPPGQSVTQGWPVLHHGSIPYYQDMSKWNLRLFGLVEAEVVITHTQFLALPREGFHNDIHCVTSWSKLDNTWEGIPINAIMEKIQLKPEATHVMLHAEHGWTTNLPLADFLKETSFLGTKHHGELLTPEHGYPLRMVVPHLYFWKSAKWLRGIEFMEKDKPGFWERNGYHMYGDPFAEQRYDFE